MDIETAKRLKEKTIDALAILYNIVLTMAESGNAKFLNDAIDQAHRAEHLLHNAIDMCNRENDEKKSVVPKVGEDKILKVFISQPMNGIPKETVFAERNKYIDSLKDINKLKELLRYNYPSRDWDFEEIEIIDTYEKPHAPEGAPRLWYLGDSIQLLGKADLVIFTTGYSRAKGCLVEMKCCKLYDIPYMIFHE